MDPITEAYILADRYPFWQIEGAELVETPAGTRIKVPTATGFPWYATLRGCPVEPAVLTTPRLPRPVETEERNVALLWTFLAGLVAFWILVLWAASR